MPKVTQATRPLTTEVEAINERFQQRKDQIKLLRHRADEAGLTEVTSLEDAVQLLFPHTAYKSYPESFLIDKRWDRLSKWLDTVSTHRVPRMYWPVSESFVAAICLGVPAATSSPPRRPAPGPRSMT